MQMMKFEPTQEPLLPTLTLGDKKAAALQDMLSTIKNTERGLGTPSTYFSNGREYPITNSIDSVVAEAQSKVNLVKGLLVEAEKAGDYRRAQAAAKIVALVEANRDLVTLYAEIVTNDPSLAHDLENVLPLLSTLSHKDSGATLQ